MLDELEDEFTLSFGMINLLTRGFIVEYEHEGTNVNKLKVS
jgi:hypothetical protein